jgi:uncharacterized protein YcbX
MSLRLSALHLYPVKSCAPLAPQQAAVQPRGLAGDRRWMVVGTDGHFITGRQEPRLTLLRAQWKGDSLQLEAPDMPALEVAPPAAAGPRQLVTVWRSRVDAPLADAAAGEWISRFVGRPCQLVFMDAQAQRAVDPQYAQPGDEVSFADAFPLLLIGAASLDHLNEQLERPVSMLRFRPNLVIEGATPHAEDGWKRIRIGAIEFELAKPCSRCVFTTIDPETAIRDADGEPLRTLTRYRQTKGGVMFGMNLIARGEGTLQVGDEVEVLA